MEARGDALENEYFYRKEQELIAKMKAKLEQEDSKSLDIGCPKCDGMLVEADFQTIKINPIIGKGCRAGESFCHTSSIYGQDSFSSSLHLSHAFAGVGNKLHIIPS